ncbi:MAG TPA: hypothetical protein VEI83_04330 [Acidimicrobiales bacterium]|nr:hypothetical protein [Acidimicrobiales bacterium]
MAPSKSTKQPPMTAEHKAALAKGREEGRAVRRYLEAIERQRPRRGRPRTLETVKRRLDTVNAKIDDADALSRLHLLQERADLEAEIAQMDVTDDLPALEKAFVKVAKSYGQRKGIDHGTWREAGVSAAVLERAGIARGKG